MLKEPNVSIALLLQALLHCYLHDERILQIFIEAVPKQSRLLVDSTRLFDQAYPEARICISTNAEVHTASEMCYPSIHMSKV
jgi:hypothetical protein